MNGTREDSIWTRQHIKKKLGFIKLNISRNISVARWYMETLVALVIWIVAHEHTLLAPNVRFVFIKWTKIWPAR